MSRVADLIEFYNILANLKSRLGGCRTLQQCSSRMRWPPRGVYFFFEPGEIRSSSGSGLRIVRVGTHALIQVKDKEKSTLRRRLSQHRGTELGAGNHRGSIFRLLLGDAIQVKGRHKEVISWDVCSSAGEAATKLGLSREEVLGGERSLEAEVSTYLGSMPFLWIAVPDDPGQGSDRGIIERNSIALLSNYDNPPLDPASKDWLGKHSSRPEVRQSGLWNNNHVDENYDPSFFRLLERYADKTEA